MAILQVGREKNVFSNIKSYKAAEVVVLFVVAAVASGLHCL
jgi:hypothetical protein